MARRVFFSFHYERDIWRASVVRNSWVTHDPAAAGYWDGSLWEEAKRKGDAALRRLIDNGLQGTSVTAVLIGAETASRKWVRYEIEQSIERGNGLLGIYIHRIGGRDGYKDSKGRNPFIGFKIPTDDGRLTAATKLSEMYDWVGDDGYHNLKDWVETAAQNAGRPAARSGQSWWSTLFG